MQAICRKLVVGKAELTQVRKGVEWLRINDCNVVCLQLQLLHAGHVGKVGQLQPVLRCINGSKLIKLGQLLSLRSNKVKVGKLDGRNIRCLVDVAANTKDHACIQHKLRFLRLNIVS